MIDAAQHSLELPEGLGKRLAPVAGMLDDAERAPVRGLIQLSGFPRQMLNASP